MLQTRHRIQARRAPSVPAFDDADFAIVDTQRMKTDATYRWIAISAKNAIILSSPLTLPPDFDRNNLELTLKLNPRDTMQ